MSICLGPYKTLSVEKNSVPWKTLKGIYLEQLFAQKGKKFWEDEILKLP